MWQVMPRPRPTAPYPIAVDQLPIVCDPQRAPANEVPGTISTVGSLIAALQDAADAIADDEAQADRMIEDAMFGMQFSLRTPAMPTEAIHDHEIPRAA